LSQILDPNSELGCFAVQNKSRTEQGMAPQVVAAFEILDAKWSTITIVLAQFWMKDLVVYLKFKTQQNDHELDA
jgi:hypothetical protein